LRAIGAHPADLLAVDRGRTRGFERLDLAGQLLIRGRDTGIAESGIAPTLMPNPTIT
jgi:hypothetical protein